MDCQIVVGTICRLLRQQVALSIGLPLGHFTLSAWSTNGEQNALLDCHVHVELVLSNNGYDSLSNPNADLRRG